MANPQAALPAVIDAVIDQPRQVALGGGMEGAERNQRETFNWSPAIISPDQQINATKDMADARGRDMVQNDGYALGAINTHRDSIVGSQFRLNAQPEVGILGAPEGWVEEYQEVAEARFNLLMDSPECYIDAGGASTLTGLLRLAVGGFLMTGEVLATAEWKRAAMRPFSTAIQMIAPSRLTNPDGLPDTPYLRRGVVRDVFGDALGYHIRMTYPTEWNDPRFLQWRYVEARKPWGRRQVIHIIEALQPGQTRGVSDMVAVLMNMRMTKQFSKVVLQNAVVNASYAAAIESELPREVVFAQMGAGQGDLGQTLGQYMTALTRYAAAADNIQVDGVKMPHLFPGTKLALKPMGTPGGVGTEFEAALLRHTAAALGLSYEQFSRDYTKTNYSSARASMAETWKYMQSRKKVVADRLANHVYLLWLEEEINAGNLPLPPGKTKDLFYDPVMREALSACSWIGASRGQIDEKKETESAILRIQNGLSTYEAECARLGEDFRRIFKQRAREEAMLRKLGLDFQPKPAAAAAASAKPAAKPADDEEDDL